MTFLDYTALTDLHNSLDALGAHVTTEIAPTIILIHPKKHPFALDHAVTPWPATTGATLRDTILECRVRRHLHLTILTASMRLLGRRNIKTLYQHNKLMPRLSRILPWQVGHFHISSSQLCSPLGHPLTSQVWEEMSFTRPLPRNNLTVRSPCPLILRIIKSLSSNLMHQRRSTLTFLDLTDTTHMAQFSRPLLHLELLLMPMHLFITTNQVFRSKACQLQTVLAVLLYRVAHRLLSRISAQPRTSTLHLPPVLLI